MLSIRGRVNDDGKFDWADAIVDASIMAMLTFFTSLGGMTATSITNPHSIVAAGIAAATEFFLILAIKRGIKKKEEV